jgi:hypothetical protein
MHGFLHESLYITSPKGVESGDLVGHGTGPP